MTTASDNEGFAPSSAQGRRTLLRPDGGNGRRRRSRGRGGRPDVLLVRRNLFAFRGNDGHEPDRDDRDDGDGGEEEEEGPPAWVRSLRRWPSYFEAAASPEDYDDDDDFAAFGWFAAPSSSPSSSTDDGTDDDEEDGTDDDDRRFPAGVPRVPLASLLDVEALLAAATTSDPFGGGDGGGGGGGGVRTDATTASSEGEGDDGAPPSSSSEPTSSWGTADPGSAALPSLEALGDWDDLVRSLRSSVFDLTATSSFSSDDDKDDDDEAASVASSGPEAVLKDVTLKLEVFLDNAANAVSPLDVRDLVLRAGRTIAALDEQGGGMKGGKGGGGLKAAADDIVASAVALAREKGLDVSDAADRARETTVRAAELVRVANGVLASGYVRGGKTSSTANDVGVNGGVSARGGAPFPPSTFGFDLTEGYVPDIVTPNIPSSSSDIDGNVADARPLFDDFPSAQPILRKSERRRTIIKGAEMSTLSGGVYQNGYAIARDLGHAIVSNGTTANVAWMVTDSFGYEEDYVEPARRTDNVDGDSEDEQQLTPTPTFVRTITIRGFDASDETIDREGLLNSVCTADPIPLGSNGVVVHRGLLQIAKELYEELMRFVDDVAPGHKVALTGHSVGGSLSVLMLLLMVEDRGADFVRDKVLKAYTFGSPPVLTVESSPLSSSPDVNGDGPAAPVNGETNRKKDGSHACSVLESFDLPSSIVYGYVQPWDPIPRLFSSIDPLYPLVGDLGEDGLTLYASGPARSLRPITRAILESWDGWSRFRSNFRDTCDRTYVSVGVQHLLLPEPMRYIADRLVSVNVAVPPIDDVLRLSSDELLPALESTFPLDVFAISFVPAAIRSFVHHFYPAYGTPFAEYAAANGEEDQESEGDGGPNGARSDVVVGPSQRVDDGDDPNDDDDDAGGFGASTNGGPSSSSANGKRPAAAATTTSPKTTNGESSPSDGKVRPNEDVRGGGADWAGAAAQWILGGVGVNGDG